MLGLKVWFNETDEELVFATGATAQHNSDTDTGTVNIDDVRAVPLQEFESAVAQAAEVRYGSDIWLLEDGIDVTGEPRYREDIALMFDENELLAVAIGDIPPYVDDQYEESVQLLLEPLAARNGAEVTGLVETDNLWPGNVAVGLRALNASETVGALLDAAALAQSLMIALRQGPLSASAARDLLATGNGSALEGLAESSWLDVKREPYRLGQPQSQAAAAWELSKDVASFANSAGGLIIVPGTERISHGKAVIDEIRALPLASVDLQQYRDVVAERVYPIVDGIDIDAVETSPGRGLFWIHIPEQREELKPFLVNGTFHDDRVLGTHVSIPRRIGADTRHAPVAELHALLVAGRARRMGRDEILDLVRRDALPWGFRELVEGAESVGLTASVGSGRLIIELPSGERVDSSFGDLAEPLLGMELHRVCSTLREHGLSVTETPQGTLVPSALASHTPEPPV